MNKHKKQLKKHNDLKVKRELKALDNIEKEIEENMDELKENIKEIVLAANSNINSWNSEEMKKYNRLEKMNEKIREEIEEKKEKEYKMIIAFLVTNSILNRKDLSKLLEKEDVKVPIVEIKDLIQTSWSGLTLAERHEKNTRNFILKIKEVTTLSIRNERASVNRTLNAIAKEIKKNSSSAFQLVDTENTHMAYGIIDKVGSKGETVLIYNAVLDEVTCEDCSEDDGKIFTYGYEEGLPRHPNCRCFYTVSKD